MKGDFVVRSPKIVSVEGEQPKQLYPVIHRGNVGVSDHAIIAWCDYEVNAQWVAKAINELRARESLEDD